MLIYRALSAVAAAAFGAAVLIALPGFSPPVEAGTTAPVASAALNEAPVKEAPMNKAPMNADRVEDRPVAAECREQT